MAVAAGAETATAAACSGGSSSSGGTGSGSSVTEAIIGCGMGVMGASPEDSKLSRNQDSNTLSIFKL